MSTQGLKRNAPSKHKGGNRQQFNVFFSKRGLIISIPLFDSTHRVCIEKLPWAKGFGGAWAVYDLITCPF
ncbi:hypothetical protein V2G26_018535 [Clonostachys chloroleuca]